LIISKDSDDLFSAILGSLTGILYQVQCTDFNCGSGHISASTFSIYLWHCRIEHLSLYIIDSMVCQKAIYRLDVFISKESDYLCNRYANGKSYLLSLQTVDLGFLYFTFYFYFIFDLFFYFSIFRTTRVRVDWSRCHISHNLMV